MLDSLHAASIHEPVCPTLSRSDPRPLRLFTPLRWSSGPALLILLHYVVEISLTIQLTSSPLYTRVQIRGHTALSSDISLARMSTCLQLCTLQDFLADSAHVCPHSFTSSTILETTIPFGEERVAGHGVWDWDAEGRGRGRKKARGWFEKARSTICLSVLFILHPRSTLGCQHVLQFLLTAEVPAPTRPDSGVCSAPQAHRVQP